MWNEEAQRRWGSLVNETDIPDPWIIAINPKIHAFNIRLVVVYSPKISGSGENEKDSFHRLLKKHANCKKDIEILLFLAISTLRYLWRLKNAAATELMLFLMILQ